ncbi:enoyl-CoA hydratase/isomerase family protein [Williamsia sterculiae]|uniref:Enoyl-CoA hydratase/carnithine racemase n=1 Tax=Williamsia sterculiae TaxID=1344003 RepID=A0A1N7CMA4_9NOCA|nr:enoyl-CoA hydratase/isomerase family protein [Williamsia sterculiae]SIR64655.1 Enoyl-CoA hydratase/carnithine racemase [Williamsia sterculiae]
MPHLTMVDNIFVLYLGSPGVENSENAFTPDWLAEVHDLLDQVDAAEGPTALITTATGKYYSTGLDTGWVMAHLDQLDAFTTAVQLLFARMLELATPTVAALPGHTFGGGALFSLAHDHALMRADRGYFCMPGVNIGASYAPGTIDFVADRTTPRAAHELLVGGLRYGGPQAVELGVVDEAVSLDDLMPRALERARLVQNTRGRALQEIKTKLHAATLERLREPAVGVNDQAVVSDR